MPIYNSVYYVDRLWLVLSTIPIVFFEGPLARCCSCNPTSFLINLKVSIENTVYVTVGQSKFMLMTAVLLFLLLLAFLLIELAYCFYKCSCDNYALILTAVYILITIT